MSRDIEINIPYNIDLFVAGLCDECDNLHVMVQEGNQTCVELVVSKRAASALLTVLDKYLADQITDDVSYDLDEPLVQ